MPSCCTLLSFSNSSFLQKKIPLLLWTIFPPTTCRLQVVWKFNLNPMMVRFILYCKPACQMFWCVVTFVTVGVFSNVVFDYDFIFVSSFLVLTSTLSLLPLHATDPSTPRRGTTVCRFWMLRLDCRLAFQESVRWLLYPSVIIRS